MLLYIFLLLKGGAAEIPVEYSRKALEKTAKKIEQVRAILKKRRNRSVAVGLIALFVSVAMFAVTILAR